MAGMQVNGLVTEQNALKCLQQFVERSAADRRVQQVREVKSMNETLTADVICICILSRITLGACCFISALERTTWGRINQRLT